MALQTITQLFPPSFFSGSTLTKTLGEEFILCENGNIIFHWADYFETCDLIKSRLESDSTLMEDFSHREVALKKLKQIPVWIKTESKVHQTTVFDLYEKYILNQSQMLVGIDPLCPLEISFISATGPYKGMSVADCFNKSTYRDFVIVYLIKGNLPRRDYRIRLKSKILLEYGQNFGQAELVALEQLTMNGILLSMDAEVYSRKIQESETIRLLVNSRSLSEAKGKSLSDLKGHLSQYAFNLLYSSMKGDSISFSIKDCSIQSSFDFAKNKRVFMFVSYEKLSSSNPEAVKSIKAFVDQTRDLVLDHYQQLKQENSA